MSTLLYSKITSDKEPTKGNASLIKGENKDLPFYVSAMAALVPSEVLALHALVVSLLTEAKAEGKIISVLYKDQETLKNSFYGMIVLSILLYVIPKIKSWDKLDFLRAMIPPLAFTAWTMLQKTTAFDAVCPGMPETRRLIYALFGAIILGVFSSILTPKAKK